MLGMRRIVLSMVALTALMIAAITFIGKPVHGGTCQGNGCPQCQSYPECPSCSCETGGVCVGSGQCTGRQGDGSCCDEGTWVPWT
jgi:hypothetical protein